MYTKHARQRTSTRRVSHEGTYEPMRTTPKPIAERYTQCTVPKCGAELEPLRRAGGVCAPCMRARMASVKPAPLEQPRVIWGHDGRMPKNDKRRAFGNPTVGKGTRMAELRKR